jgi:hypothetical protein
MVFLLPSGEWQETNKKYVIIIFSVVISLSFMWLYKMDESIYELYDPAAQGNNVMRPQMLWKQS